MGYGNRYFVALAPIRWFGVVGTAPSNTYIGSSRAIDTVHRAGLIQPGDAIHAIGNTYLVRTDGRIETGRLNLPKPILEKSYGPPMTDGDLLEQMAKQGLCEEIAAPEVHLDYRAKAVRADARYPDCTGTLLRETTPPSPVLQALIDAAENAGLPAAIAHSGGRLTPVDVGLGADPTSLNVSLRIHAETATVELLRSAGWPTLLVHFVQGSDLIDRLAARAAATFGRRSERWLDVAPAAIPDFLRALSQTLGAPQPAEP